MILSHGSHISHIRAIPILAEDMVWHNDTELRSMEPMRINWGSLCSDLIGAYYCMLGEGAWQCQATVKYTILWWSPQRNSKPLELKCSWDFFINSYLETEEQHHHCFVNKDYSVSVYPQDLICIQALSSLYTFEFITDPPMLCPDRKSFLFIINLCWQGTHASLLDLGKQF